MVEVPVPHAHTPPNTDEASSLPAEAVARLVEGHQKFLRFLERRVPTREHAEDLLQKAFVRALERGHTLREGESATAWFYRLLRNALIDDYRARAAHDRAMAAAGRDPSVTETDEELLEAVCECIQPLMDTVKAEYAEILRRVDLGGQRVTDAAGELGITANSAGVRLHRARQALHRRLVQCCGTCATHGCLDCQCSSSEHPSNKPSSALHP